MTNIILKILEIKWTIGRDANTYGYNICTLYVDGQKVATTNGGGYDMTGTVIGKWLTNTYEPYLRYLTANYGSGDNTNGFYGLVIYNNKTRSRVHRVNQKAPYDQYSVSIDGACGINSVISIAEKIGIKIDEMRTADKNLSIFIATINPKLEQ